MFKHKNYLIIAIGVFIFAIGINLFIVPSGIFATGVYGFSQEISYILTQTYELTGIIYFTLNIPILTLSWFKVGRKFTLRTLYSIVLLTIFQSFLPTTQQVDGIGLQVMTGSIICGIGLGLILKQGGSTGGTDIIAMYFSLIKGKGFGGYQLITNFVVILLAAFITKDLETAIYMIISLYVLGIVIDKIYNSHEKLTLMVVTTKPTEIRDVIFSEISRGCTIIDSYGGQSFTKNHTVVLTISKGELYKAINILTQIDEKAFINVLPVESVVGYFQNNFKGTLD